MRRFYWISFFLAFSSSLGVLHASIGDADPSYRSCLTDCGTTGCVGTLCFPHCNFSSNGVSVDGPWYIQEPQYIKWKQLYCQSDCRYHCMLNRETERAASGHEPVKYHGKWPFKRVFGVQEPASVAFSVLNLVHQIHRHVRHVCQQKTSSSRPVCGRGTSTAGVHRANEPSHESVPPTTSVPLPATGTSHVPRHRGCAWPTAVPHVSAGPSAEYNSFGSCDCVCSKCHAKFWFEEKLSTSTRYTGPLYHRCCLGGKVLLSLPREYLAYIRQLFSDPHFLTNIRAYNQMFAMTSLGATVDESVNKLGGCF